LRQPDTPQLRATYTRVCGYYNHGCNVDEFGRVADPRMNQPILPGAIATSPMCDYTRVFQGRHAPATLVRIAGQCYLQAANMPEMAALCVPKRRASVRGVDPVPIGSARAVSPGHGTLLLLLPLNVVGMTEGQAQMLLNQRGLLASVTVRGETHPGPWPQAIVVAQDPVAGATVPSGSTVTLVVSG
jgi:hypothetical protein